MNTSNSPVVAFPAITEHASQVLMDLLVVGRGLNSYVGERFHSLARFLPRDFRRSASDLAEIFAIVAMHVENGTTDEIGYIIGETTRKLLEDVAIGAIRRATVALRDVNLMFDSGVGPTVVTKSESWGRFSKDLLVVKAILACVNRPKKDEHGKVVRDEKGDVIKLRGLFIPPHTFLGRRANPGELAQDIQPPLGYLDGLIKLNENLGSLDYIEEVIGTLRMVTRSGRN